jgi:dTMP kinase
MLIAIEGVDKSGKETQANLLTERLLKENLPARKVEFPNYSSDAAGAVKMYLNGDFGGNPDDVNPYAASVLFAVDRFASYKTDWGGFAADGGIVVADRYTMSNMIHQGVKITDPDGRRRYIDWLIDLEFVKMGLPEPELVIFLDMPMDLRVALSENYAKKSPQAQRADIHERNLDYLRRAHICAGEIAAQLGWTRVEAGCGGGLRTADDVHAEVYAAAVKLIRP